MVVTSFGKAVCKYRKKSFTHKLYQLRNKSSTFICSFLPKYLLDISSKKTRGYYSFSWLLIQRSHITSFSRKSITYYLSMYRNLIKSNEPSQLAQHINQNSNFEQRFNYGLVFLIHCCNIYGNSEGFHTLLGYTLPKQKTS